MCEYWKQIKPLACPDADGEDWLAKWAPPCPDGHPQRLLDILGFRVKGEDLIQIRVLFRRWDHGVCQLVVDEHPDRIYVRAITHDAGEPDREDSSWFKADEIDCGCRVWLDAPLGERIVIDVDTGEELPLFILRWGTDGDRSVYIPRPPGLLWPPVNKPRAT